MTGQPISIRALRAQAEYEVAQRTDPDVPAGVIHINGARLLALVEAVEAAKGYLDWWRGDGAATEYVDEAEQPLADALARFTDWPDGTTDSG